MIGELNPDQITELLQAEVIGRIGCSANGITYVVPVTYAYDDGYIYAHSKEGKKIQMMRMNPNVCFEVDRMSSNAEWKCVILWGKFEELHGDERKMGLQKLIRRMHEIETSETALPQHPDAEAHQNTAGPYKTIVFRIRVKERTGRFETRQNSWS